MLERYEKLLKLACLILAAAVLYQLSHAMLAKSPVAGLVIPALPSLPTKTNANAIMPVAGPAPISRGSNSNVRTTAKGTNPAPPVEVAAMGTNAIRRGGTNSVRVAISTNSLPTSNGPAMIVAMNGASAPDSPGPRGARGARAGGPRAGGPRGGRGAPADVPAEVRPLLDKIVQSEILGAVVHPMPMALMGIAGDEIILRAPNGQTGLVKMGAELGGIKVIRIGVNRVLIEENGQQRELTLFSGVGGESLEPKPKSNANETNK